MFWSGLLATGDAPALDPALIGQQYIVEQHAFFFDAAAYRRHGSWRHAADIGVVAARRDISDGFGAGTEGRHNHGDIGQMRSATIGCV